MDYIQIRLGPPSKTATMARPTLSSSRAPFLALRCAAPRSEQDSCAMPCLPGTTWTLRSRGFWSNRHASINPRIADELSSRAKWPGALRAGRTTDHVVQLVRLVRVRASASQGVEKAKTKAGLDPKSRYDIVRRTCSRPRRRQRKRGEGGPGPTGESSLRFSSTGPLLRSGDVWRSSKQSHPYQRSN